MSQECRLSFLGLVLSFDAHRSPTTVRLGDSGGEVLGVIEYRSALDAYTSSVDPDPRTLFDQLQLLVHTYLAKRRTER